MKEQIENFEKVYEPEITVAANEKAAEMGLCVYQQIMEETKTPGELQEKLLLKILTDNAETEYGKKYGFSDIHSICDYQKQVPVITYEDISEDMERMLNGEKNVLTSYEFNHMNMTSGTSGKPKYIPLTKEQQNIFVKYNYAYTNGLIEKFIDKSYKNGRVFTPIGGSYETAPSGITTGCASIKAAEFIGGMEALDQQMRIMFTSPCEVLGAPADTDTKYIHMRFAMMDRNLCGINIGFFSYLVQLFHYIEINYKTLIDDIEKGTISDEIEIDRTLREKLLKKIKPMPQRAAELREIFKNGAQIPFVPLVWPNLKYIMGVGGDGFAIYDKIIKEKYTGGTVPHIYSGITSSEGLWSIPGGINTPDGILAVSSAFMEFLPVDAEDDFSKIKTIEQLEVGKVYELIVTDYCGLYRYRMSDSVLVTGFENKTPRVEFMYRVNKTINIGGEKLTEIAINMAMEKFAKENNLDIVDFNVYADKEKTPGQHQFLLEFSPNSPVINLEELRPKLLEKLDEANNIMMMCYKKGYISMPAIFRLQPETNMLYRDIQIYKGKPAAQIKPVRIISTEEQRKFFFTLLEE